MSFFQFRSALSCGSISSGCSAADAAGRRAQGELVGEVEGLSSQNVDRSGDAALDERRLRAFVHDDLVDELRRQQRVAHAAADLLNLVQNEPVAGCNVVTIEESLGQAGIGSAHADAVVFVETALVGARRADGDAREPRQRVRDVLVRHLADVFGRDDLDDRIGAALRVERFLVRVTNAGDDHFFQLLGPRRIVLCEECDGDGSSDQCRPCAVHVL